MKGSGAPAATRNRTAGQVRAPETHNRDRSARILAEAHVETEAIHLRSGRHGRPEASGSSSARAGRRRDGRNGNAGREVAPSFFIFWASSTPRARTSTLHHRRNEVPPPHAQVASGSAIPCGGGGTSMRRVAGAGISFFAAQAGGAARAEGRFASQAGPAPHPAGGCPSRPSGFVGENWGLCRGKPHLGVLLSWRRWSGVPRPIGAMPGRRERTLPRHVIFGPTSHWAPRPRRARTTTFLNTFRSY
jgi:hypothetical protein